MQLLGAVVNLFILYFRRTKTRHGLDKERRNLPITNSTDFSHNWLWEKRERKKRRGIWKNTWPPSVFWTLMRLLPPHRTSASPVRSTLEGGSDGLEWYSCSNTPKNRLFNLHSHYLSLRVLSQTSTHHPCLRLIAPLKYLVSNEEYSSGYLWTLDADSQ